MKTRIVHTKVWEKDHFNEKSTEAKLLFMYLITNQYINLIGAYEISDRIMKFETGLKDDELEKAKKELMPKVIFFKGWVFVKNASKYSLYKGDNNEKCKAKETALLPENIRKCFIDGICDIPSKPLDTPSTSTTEVSVSAPRNSWNEKTPAEQMKSFLENEDSLFSVGNSVPIETPIQEIVIDWMMHAWKVEAKVAENEMQKFISYWTEPMPSGKKVRWQIEKTFELKRRIIRWMSNKHEKAVAGTINNKYQVQL